MLLGEVPQVVVVVEVEKFNQILKRQEAVSLASCGTLTINRDAILTKQLQSIAVWKVSIQYGGFLRV